MSELTVIGKSVTRVDANEKVTGEAIYGYDLVLPNMLYGKTLFSPKAHAKIKRIDTEKAKRFPGVVAVERRLGADPVDRHGGPDHHRTRPRSGADPRSLGSAVRRVVA